MSDGARGVFFGREWSQRLRFLFQTIGTGWRIRAWLKTSSMRETGTISSAFLTASEFQPDLGVFFRIKSFLGLRATRKQFL